MTCLKYNGIVGPVVGFFFSGFSDLIKSFAGLQQISSEALKQQKLGVIERKIHASKHQIQL